MSTDAIIFHGIGDTINSTLNLKANTMTIKGNLNVPFINGFPYIGGSVNVGTPRQLLQTDAMGVAPEWTSDIKVDDCEIDAQLILNGDSGSNGEIILKSGGVPTWGVPTFSLPSIPIGTADQILTTNSIATQAVWSSDIKVNNCEIDGSINLNGDLGTNGEIIIKSGGVPTWGLPTFSLPSIPVGTARQLLQTNAGGTSAQWTSDISVANVNITGNFTMNSSSGLVGQPLVRTSSISQNWGSMNSAYIIPGTPNQVLVTSNDASTSQWSSGINVATINMTSSLSFNGSNGTTGQYVRKNGSAQQWSHLTAGDINPGPASSVMITNSGGNTVSFATSVPVNGNLIFNGVNGTAGQFVKKASGTQVWANIESTDIEPGGANQVMVTDPTGTFVTWSSVTDPITPGTSYQVLQTNSTASAAEWTSQFRGTSILFNSANQSLFDRYYYNDLTLNMYLVPPGGASRFLQAVTTSARYTIMGKMAYVTVFPFDIILPIGTTNPSYVALLITEALLTPKIVSPEALNSRQMTVACSTSDNNTTGSFTSFASIYTTYYAYQDTYIEIVKNDSGTYNPNSNHGGPFVGGVFDFMTMKAPFTLQYYLN